MVKKHISGLSGVYQDTLYVIFNYSSDFGHDPLGNVEDVTVGGVAPSSVEYSLNKVTIKYLNYNSPIGGFKTYQVTFQSGYTADINVDVLGTNRAVAQFTTGHVGLAGDCSVDMNYIQSAFGRGLQNQVNTYAALAISDPGNVFGYQNLWEQPETSLFNFNGSVISNTWLANGYSGGLPVSTIQGLQHVRFVTAVNTTIQDLYALGIDPMAGGAGLFMHALYDVTTNYGAIIAFDWSLDLRSCKTSRSYDVCKDPASPSYFTTTGQNCSGVAIPADVLNGSTNAIFNDGCGCAVDCLGMTAGLTITPATSTAANDGTFTITVSGGTANYTYLLTVPSGVTYGGTPNPGATSSTSHTFTGVSGTQATAGGLYTISVNDAGASGGCTRSFKVYMPISEGSLNNLEGCTDSNSFNYNSNATVDDGSCILCKSTGQLIVGGVVVGNFVSDSGTTITNASTNVATDGSIQFSGQIDPSVDPFIASDFDITLHTTTGNGGALSAAIATETGATSPATTFSTLASGWYAVKVVPGTGSATCIATYYYYIGYQEGESDCEAFVDLDIDPCTGAMHINYNFPEGTSLVGGYFTVNNTQYDLSDPVIVEQGDTVYVSLNLNSANPNCKIYTETFELGEALFNCPPDPEPEVPGCTDPAAENYNPSATVNDGSCSYPVLGCTDPEAANFNPNAEINDGSCIYGVIGCTDPQATNYDPNATIDDGSCFNACSEQIINSITVEDTGAITISFTNITTSYSVTWVNNETGASITTEDTTVGPDLADGVYTVTVTDGNGCTDDYTLGVNTTIVYGCMDIYADNYNPAANASDPLTRASQCEYTFGQSPCVPGQTEQIRKELDKCLNGKLNTLYNMIKAGRTTPCKTKDAIVLKLMRYIISRKGLECVYNCADSLSPTYSETPQGTTCGDKWSEGGPSGDSLTWSATATYVWGDIVKHPTSDDIYTMTLNPNIGSYVVGSDPETQAGLQYWEYCKEPFEFADITNRLDKYLAYIRQECKDCNIPGFTPIDNNPRPTSDARTPATEDGTSLNIEGEELDL